jgi:hypothetical protein
VHEQRPQEQLLYDYDTIELKSVIAILMPYTTQVLENGDELSLRTSSAFTVLPDGTALL